MNDDVREVLTRIGSLSDEGIEQCGAVFKQMYERSEALFAERILQIYRSKEDFPGRDSVQQLYRSLCAESDRGAILVSVALIDEALDRLFRKKFQLSCKEPNSGRLLEGGTAPLQSISNKNLLAHSLGLIDPVTHQGIAAINKFRSKVAAHTHSPLTIQTMDGLLEKELQESIIQIKLDSLPPLGVRQLLCLVVSCLLVNLEKVTQAITKIDPSGLPTPGPCLQDPPLAEPKDTPPS